MLHIEITQCKQMLRTLCTRNYRNRDSLLLSHDIDDWSYSLVMLTHVILVSVLS